MDGDRLGSPRPLITLASKLIPISLFFSICFAQHQHVHPLSSANGQNNLPPGTIDGALTPQLISDAVAYRLFLNAACEQPQSKLDEKGRQRAMLSRARLTEAEITAVASILAGYHRQIADVERAWNSAVADPKVASSAAQNFSAQRDALVTATKASLALQLSLGGMHRLDQLIQSEKRNMKVVPYPNMP